MLGPRTAGVALESTAGRQRAISNSMYDGHVRGETSARLYAVSTSSLLHHAQHYSISVVNGCLSSVAAAPRTSHSSSRASTVALS